MSKIQTRHSISISRPIFDRALAWLSTPAFPHKGDQPFWKPPPMSAYVEGLVRLDAMRGRSEPLGKRVPKKRKGRLERGFFSLSDACYKLAKSRAQLDRWSMAMYIETLITRHLDDQRAPPAGAPKVVPARNVPTEQSGQRPG